MIEFVFDDDEEIDELREISEREARLDEKLRQQEIAAKNKFINIDKLHEVFSRNTAYLVDTKKSIIYSKRADKVLEDVINSIFYEAVDAKFRKVVHKHIEAIRHITTKMYSDFDKHIDKIYVRWSDYVKFPNVCVELWKDIYLQGCSKLYDMMHSICEFYEKESTKEVVTDISTKIEEAYLKQRAQKK